MLMFLTMMSMMLALNFALLMHPLSLGLVLLAQTIIMTVILGFMNINLWFSYMLFLVMMGGMLVLFVYMTNVASNEKFNFAKYIPLLALSTVKLIILITIMSDNFLQSYTNFHKNIMSYPVFKEASIMLSKYLNSPSMIILTLLVLYLLLTLIVVVSVTKHSQGPLRQKK